MVCAPPFTPFGMANPFQLWQDALKALQPQPAPQPAPANPMQAIQDQFQQGFALWRQMLMPQAMSAAQPGIASPKITVTTIELGDIRPYMDMAVQMMTAMQPILQSTMSTMFGQLTQQTMRGRP